MDDLENVERQLADAFKPYGQQALDYFWQGDWQTALVYFRERVDVRSPGVQTSLRRLGQAVNNMALTRNRQGDIEGAERAYLFALMIHCELLNRMHPEAAVTLGNVGFFLFQRENDLKRGFSFLAQALEVWKVLCRTEPGYIHYLATCLAGLGEIFIELREYDRGRQNLEQALSLRQNIFRGGHPDIETTLSDLGVVCALQGDLKTASDYFQRGFEMRKARLGANDPSTRNLAESARQLANNQIPEWIKQYGKQIGDAL